MCKPFKLLYILVGISIFIIGCTAQNIHAQPAATKIATHSSYQTMLGKLVSDQEVVKFFAGNHCVAATQFELCNEIGMSFWIDTDQHIGTIYLYSGETEGVQRYRGKLPYGLTFYDPMWLVQEKLSALDKDDLSQKAGLPDEADTRDYIHYWAIYKQLGLVVVYDAGIADPDAYIYEVLVSK